MLILVAATIPTPGGPGRGYWKTAGYGDSEFDDNTFYHDLSPDSLALAKRAEGPQEDKPMSESHPLERSPAVPTHYLLCKNDHVLPAPTTRRIVRERLGIEPNARSTLATACISPARASSPSVCIAICVWVIGSSHARPVMRLARQLYPLPRATPRLHLRWPRAWAATATTDHVPNTNIIHSFVITGIAVPGQQDIGFAVLHRGRRKACAGR
jgi:hypothetical protein